MDSLPLPPVWSSADSSRRLHEANSKLESVAQSSVNWGVKHERQIQDLEAELASALSNSRAVHNLLVEALGSIEANRQRVDRALITHVPHIYHELNSSMISLRALSDRLPELRSHVRAIRSAYDSGRSKAQVLTGELEWKRLPVQEKLFHIAFRSGFTRSSRKSGGGEGVSGTRTGAGTEVEVEVGVVEVPVRKRTVWMVRMILVLCFLILLGQLTVAVDGAYRAYRHRLVWGDKLIS